MANKGVLLDFGKGERTISLCYVDDLVKTILRSMHQKLPSGSVYFFADQKPYKWTELEDGYKENLEFTQNAEIINSDSPGEYFCLVGSILREINWKAGYD